MQLYEYICINIILIYKRKYIFNVFLVLSLLIINTYKYEYTCLNCINEEKRQLCSICKNNIIFKGIRIYNDDDTLNEIINKNKSISRYGDGEFKFIFGRTIGFQKYNKEMSQRLLDILNSKEKNLLIGINAPYKLKNLDRFNQHAKEYYTAWFNRFKFKLAKILKNKVYYSSTITRFYMDLKSKKGVPNYIKKLKKIWEQRDIVIIEGEKSRLGIGNNLFNNTKSIQRIICPVTNAFNHYSEIINIVKNNVNKNKLILIALGPTATILAFDLYKIGYHAIDVGHVDIEYEWFLRNAKRKISIKNKYVNERRGRQKRFTKVRDENYYRQIIAKVLD